MAVDYVAYDGPIVTLDQARKASIPRYFTGKPCKRGHISERHTSSTTCYTCHTVKIKADPGHQSALAKARRLADPDKALANDRKYREGNRDGRKASSLKWRLSNYDQALFMCNEWKRQNPDKCAVHRVTWQTENPEHYKSAQKANRSRRRARKRDAEGHHTAKDIIRIGDLQKWKCHWCSKPTKKNFHADHIIPLSKGGGNGPGNICVSCPGCNLRKNAKHPIDWARENGRLL